MTRSSAAPALAANRSMPTSTVIPVLAYDDAREAARWLCRCFGFEERLRIGDHRVQLTFGDGAVVTLTRPLEVGAAALATHSLMVRVADVDAHHSRARAEGARIRSAPATEAYGERQYSAEDLGGHAWTFSQSVRDVEPREWGGELVER